MTAIDLDATAALAVFGSRRDHSPLWHWMKANHDALIERAGGDRMPWIELCEVFARQELFNRAGKAPTPACAKLTWHRLRAYMAKARQRHEAMRREMEDAQDRRRAERRVRRQAEAIAAARTFVTNQQPMNRTQRVQPPVAPPIAPVSTGSVAPAHARSFLAPPDDPSKPDPYAHLTPEQRARVEAAYAPIRREIREENRWRGGDYALDE